MRMGKKKHPTYRIVASDSRSPRDGRFIEIVGTYAPREDPSSISIDNKRAVTWLTNGAKASDTVRKLLEISGAWGEFRAQQPERPGKPPRKRKPSVKAAKKQQAAKAAKKTVKKQAAKKQPAKKAAPEVVETTEPLAEAADAPEVTTDEAATTTEEAADAAATPEAEMSSTEAADSDGQES